MKWGIWNMENKSRKILFIDNDTEAILPCMEALLRKNFDVYSARNSREGLLRFGQYTPDIVVLNISEDQIGRNPERYSLSTEMRRLKPEVKIIGWGYENVYDEERRHYDRTMTKFSERDGVEEDSTKLLRLVEDVK